MTKRIGYLIVLYIIVNAISPQLAKAVVALITTIIYSLVNLLMHSAFGTALSVKQSVANTFISMDITQIFVNGMFVLLGFAILFAAREIVKSLWR